MISFRPALPQKALIVTTITAMGFGTTASAQSTLNGAGATFPAPFYQPSTSGLLPGWPQPG